MDYNFSRAVHTLKMIQKCFKFDVNTTLLFIKRSAVLVRGNKFIVVQKESTTFTNGL